MELACRGYMRETPGEVEAANWPCAYDEGFAAPMRAALERVLRACIDFAKTAA
jgi:formiminoglutamase